jgi:succinyl-CoA synthetase beta subunit
MSIKGLVVEKVLVVPTAEIASECYVGLIMGPRDPAPVFMVSAAGGVDIEEVAAKTAREDHRLRWIRAMACWRTGARARAQAL